MMFNSPVTPHQQSISHGETVARQEPRQPRGLDNIAAHFGLPAGKIVRVQDRAFNDRRYYIGNDKLAALGWTERTSWEDGLRKTIAWYMDYKDAGYWVGDVEQALLPHPQIQ
jgi:UDP-glucose 4,6-dehydratase